jgi:hypothetical protein
MSARRGRVGQAEGPRYHASDVTSSFLDIRRHGFARVAVCVPEVLGRDPAFNVDAHLTARWVAYTPPVQYAVCPELSCPAYSCGDLFFQEPLLRGVLAALERLARETAAWDSLVSVRRAPRGRRQPLQLRRDALRRPARRRDTESLPARLSRVLRAALVPAGGGGAQRHDRAPRSRRPVQHRRPTDAPPHGPQHRAPCGRRGPLDAVRRARSRRSPAPVLANLSASNVTVGN